MILIRPIIIYQILWFWFNHLAILPTLRKLINRRTLIKNEKNKTVKELSRNPMILISFRVWYSIHIIILNLNILKWELSIHFVSYIRLGPCILYNKHNLSFAFIRINANEFDMSTLMFFLSELFFRVVLRLKQITLE